MSNSKFIPPNCKDGYRLLPNNCWCEKIPGYETKKTKTKTKTKVKRKSSKNELNNFYKKLVEKNSSKFKSLKIELHKKCPKGYKRNKKSGHCDLNLKAIEKNNKKLNDKKKKNKEKTKKIVKFFLNNKTHSKKKASNKKHSKNIGVIQTKNPTILKTNSDIENYQGIVHTLHKQGTRSYSPQINKKLNTLKNIIKKPI